MPAPSDFTWRGGRDGDMQIYHHGRLATTLRNNKAERLRQLIEAADDDAVQAYLARVTGNYRRGNERSASRHPRNRS